MKAKNTSSITKLVARFDNELKNLLLEDLKAIKSTKDQLLNSIKGSIQSNNLSAA